MASDGPTHESAPAERVARGWTQLQTVDALRMQSDRLLPDSAHLLRMWKNWEHGKHRPRAEYQLLIASTFGTVGAGSCLGCAPAPGAPSASASMNKSTRTSTRRISSASLAPVASARGP